MKSEESMKNKINAAIAKISPQAISAGDIGATHELAAIGITEDKQLDLVLALEAEIKDLNGLEIDVPDEEWERWQLVGNIYRFYGCA